VAYSRPFDRDEAKRLWARLVSGWADHVDESGARLLIDGVTNPHDAGGSYEGVTRMLWGLGGWLSLPGRPTIVSWRGVEYDLVALTRRAVLSGTDPASPGYWGVPEEPGASDQRTVESGQVAFALWQSRHHVWQSLTDAERARVIAWLAACGEPPPAWRNNWALFWAVNHRVRAALGAAHQPGLVESVLDYLDGVYCGNGWYDDGPNRGTDHFDDYNLWVFASHVLAWAQIEDDDPERKEVLIDRVRQQMEHVPYFFAADGAYTEYGRSLSYKFARLGAPIWAYHAKCWPHGPGVLKRLVGRHLRWYADRGAIRADGTLTQSLTGEGTPEVRETYISTGATYWAMQAFGALWTLSDDDPFWLIEEEPLPVERDDFVRVMPEPGFVLTGTQATGAVQRFSSRSQYVPAKYGKFHYTTAAPFNVGLDEGQPLPDAMLCLTDGTHRGHKDRLLASAVGEPGWLRFRYEQHLGSRTHTIETIVVPRGEAHLRVHTIRLDPETTEPIGAIEGGGPLGYPAGALPRTGAAGGISWAANSDMMTAIAGVEGYAWANSPSSFGAPGANSVFGNQLIPSLQAERISGAARLICICQIGSVLSDPDQLRSESPQAEFEADGTCRVRIHGAELVIPPLDRESANLSG
jgi:hypothetical protein